MNVFERVVKKCAALSLFKQESHLAHFCDGMLFTLPSNLAIQKTTTLFPSHLVGQYLIRTSSLQAYLHLNCCYVFFKANIH